MATPADYIQSILASLCALQRMDEEDLGRIRYQLRALDEAAETAVAEAESMAAEEAEPPDVNNEAPPCDCGEPTCLGTCYHGEE